MNIMNTENKKVMTNEAIELFKDKYCDVSICNNIMEEQDIPLCCIGYDEVDELLIIEKNGEHFELNDSEIEAVDIEDEKDTVITLTFTDGTTIAIRPLNNLEVRRRYADELLILEIIRDNYKRELFEDFNE